MNATPLEGASVAVQTTSGIDHPPKSTNDHSPDAVHTSGQNASSREAAGSLANVDKRQRQKDSSTSRSSPTSSPFDDPVAASEPVNLASLLDEIYGVVRSHVILDEHDAVAATLWIAHSHMTGAANVSPLAIINAPERACAKTLFQSVLGKFVRRPLHASNATMSAMFRAVQTWHVTLMIDEADTFFRDNKDLHGMVNAGYQKDGYVLRSEQVGDTFEPKAFSVYGAKSIAGIGLERHLPDATLSRGIHFNMRRKLSHEKVKRLRDLDDALVARLNSQLVRAAEDNICDVRDARPMLPSELSDRAQDNWEPLLAIAEVAGGEWPLRASKAAIRMGTEGEDQGSPGNDLLADVMEILATWKAPTIKTVDLIKRLTDDPDAGWDTYNRGKPLTPRQLARLLSSYGIRPKTVRQPKDPLNPNGSTPKGYEIAEFNEVFARYVTGTKKSPAEVAATPQPVEDDSDLY